MSRHFRHETEPGALDPPHRIALSAAAHLKIRRDALCEESLSQNFSSFWHRGQSISVPYVNLPPTLRHETGTDLNGAKKWNKGRSVACKRIQEDLHLKLTIN